MSVKNIEQILQLIDQLQNVSASLTMFEYLINQLFYNLPSVIKTGSENDIDYLIDKNILYLLKEKRKKLTSFNFSN